MSEPEPLHSLEQAIAKLLLDTEAFLKGLQWPTPEDVRRSETDYLEELWRKPAAKIQPRPDEIGYT